MDKSISLTIDGQPISGIITDLSRSGIIVEITSPFSGYRADRYVPTFARASRNYLEIGDEVAAELITTLYQDLKLLSAKRHSLVAEVETLLSSLSQNKTCQAELLAKKPELKQQFKAGQLDQKEYQKSLKAISDQAFQQSRQSSELVEQFIDEHLPDWGYGLDHEQFIGFLSSD
ncbi:hypothetical protein [Salinisphaera sp. G21_0]|uniref:hypothetical protein n=1 Tax=Salinisphaera sp. G21_0 TaxID=2821094 RepID=UPI001ADD13D7|nr:hypothetical protein [Salinisphaera sp. G21_0]MBO9484304.1 hypothetical protein [Salinisphaera sp. G21_0]